MRNSLCVTRIASKLLMADCWLGLPPISWLVSTTGQLIAISWLVSATHQLIVSDPDMPTWAYIDQGLLFRTKPKQPNPQSYKKKSGYTCTISVNTVECRCILLTSKYWVAQNVDITFTLQIFLQSSRTLKAFIVHVINILALWLTSFDNENALSCSRLQAQNPCLPQDWTRR